MYASRLATISKELRWYGPRSSQVGICLKDLNSWSSFGKTSRLLTRIKQKKTGLIFVVLSIPAHQKATALLWIIHRFLETQDVLADLQSATKIQVPFTLSRGDTSQENADTKEEEDFGLDAQKQRAIFMNENKKLVLNMAVEAEGGSSGSFLLACSEARMSQNLPSGTGHQRRSGLRTQHTETREGSVVAPTEYEGVAGPSAHLEPLDPNSSPSERRPLISFVSRYTK